MLREQKKFLSQLLVISVFFLVILCSSKYKGDFLVIKTYYTLNAGCPSFVLNGNIKLTIEYIRKYKRGKLIEYQGCASEGLYTKNFMKDDDYSMEDKAVKLLSIKREGKFITFYDKKYEIERESKDTIFTKSSVKDEYLIFVGEIPQE